jgi:protocatechuate 3,4-dioxygenase beta subunit
LSLVDTATDTTVATTTDADGNYSFTGLQSGQYQVIITPGSSVVPPYTDDNDFTYDQGNGDAYSDTVTLSPGATATIDGGLITDYLINGSILDDYNGNGQADDNQGGVQGVEIDLYDSSNNLLASTTTNALGCYYFSGLAASQYQVVIDYPSAWTASPGSSDNQFSSGSLGYQTGTIDLSTGQVQVANGLLTPTLTATTTTAVLGSPA